MNSLRGAVLTQGILLAMKLRANNPGIAISEAHPKALIKALALESWSDLADRFKIIGTKPAEHERDALLGAIVAREAARGEGNWVDLSLDRNSNELNPKTHWFGPVSYWWPEKLELV